MAKTHIKILIITLVLVVGGLTSYTLIKNGYFPVASVNGQLISYQTVKDNAEVSRKVYQQGLAGSSPELDKLFAQANSQGLIKNSLESLITNAILKKTASADILAKAQKEITDNFGETASVADSIKNIYGWDTATYEQRILEPQALINVLSQEKKADFSAWFLDQKKSANVQIWFLPYKWQDGQLENK